MDIVGTRPIITHIKHDTDGNKKWNESAGTARRSNEQCLALREEKAATSEAQKNTTRERREPPRTRRLWPILREKETRTTRASRALRF